MQEDKLNKIDQYRKKIQDIRNKVHERQRKFAEKKLEEVSEDHLLDSDEAENADDFLLADVESESEDDTPDEDDEYKPLQVFFCSRTHSQLSQVVGEVKSTIYKKELRSVSLGSRQNYCINKEVKKLHNNNAINERCLELQKSKSSKSTKKDEDQKITKQRKLSAKSCPFFKKNLEKLRNLSLSKVMDIEELVKVGTEEKTCPYYASRAAVSDSQLIFVPYQILLSKTTREQCGIRLKGNIVIVDEAHNLMDTISQIHTANVTLDQLRTCHTQMINYKIKYLKRFGAKSLLKINQLVFIAKQLVKFLENNGKAPKAFELHEVLTETSIYNHNLVDLLKFCDQTHFAAKVHGFARIFEKLQAEEKLAESLKQTATKSLLLELQEKSKKKSSKAIEVEEENQENMEAPSQPNVLRIFLQFLECLLQRHDGGRLLVTFDETTQVSSMRFLLLDPSSPFADIIKDCRSIILAGGTMKPTDELTDQLFRDCKQRVEIHSFGHVVPSDAILPIALSRGCTGKEFMFTHANKNNEVLTHEAAMTISNICKVVPGGVVCFFTSYDNLNRFYQHISDKKIIETMILRKDVYVEPRTASKTEKVLDDYAKSVKGAKKGAIIFSVIGGKLSEGMNFSDDLGRCVIVVGLPFPNKFSPELAEKLKFISSNVSAAVSSEYYENLCMKAVNQSIGRAIRHIGDYATVILMDARYHRQNIIQKLPDWIKANLKLESFYGMAHGSIVKFFRDHSKT